MKRVPASRLLTWTLMLTLPFWFSNCGKKDGDTVTPSASSIEGTWTFSGLKIDPAFDLTGSGTKTNDLLALLASLPGGADAATCFKTTKITFLSGGKISGVAGQKCTSANGTDLIDTNSSWKLDGNKLTLTDSSGSEVYNTAISGNTLKLSQTNSDTDWDGDGKKDTVTQTIELTKS